MKFLLYLVGLRRSSGTKSGEFIYNSKYDKFIYQGRELDAEEFNTLMAKQWPLQRMANQQVSGFVVTEPVAVIEPEPDPVEAPKTTRPYNKKATS
jgi:hypothetical protein